MYERLAERARNPFLRAVLHENCVVAVPPLHKSLSDPPQSWGYTRERMIREILNLPLAGLI
jgi:hypothetical protein